MVRAVFRVVAALALVGVGFVLGLGAGGDVAAPEPERDPLAIRATVFGAPTTSSSTVAPPTVAAPLAPSTVAPTVPAPSPTTAAEVEEVEEVPAPSPSSGRCGGDLPPCSVMQCESGGDITAENPTSSASGKWQFIDGTWNGYMGYPRASDAPEWVQDQRAREVYAGGAGASHWEQCS